MNAKSLLGKDILSIMYPNCPMKIAHTNMVAGVWLCLLSIRGQIKRPPTNRQEVRSSPCKPHTANNKAVWEAYGKLWPFEDEPTCVAYLMALYQKLKNSVT